MDLFAKIHQITAKYIIFLQYHNTEVAFVMPSIKERMWTNCSFREAVIYKSLGPLDPTHPYLGHFSQIKPLGCMTNAGATIK